MFSKIKFVINYLSKLSYFIKPFKKHYVLLIILIFINALIESIITYGIIIISSSYLNLNDYFSDLFSNFINHFYLSINKYTINKDYLIIYSLFLSLILRQISLGINQSYMHYLNNSVTAYVRLKITKNYIKKNKDNNNNNFISGSIEQVLSQDSKFTAQSFYFFIQFISMFFYLIFSIILLYLISFNLLIILIIFTFFIVPLKIFYSKLILVSASNSKSLEYKMMSKLSDIQKIILNGISTNEINFFNKFSNYVNNSAKKETFFRILMLWEAFFIQIFCLFLILILIIFDQSTSIYNIVQLIAFGFVIYRTIPFVTKLNKFFNSFISRHELVMRTYNLYMK